MPEFAQQLEPISLSDEMTTSYTRYAMSVIIGRAFPDVRDGLKISHRRILHAMNEVGNLPNRPHKKSASTVGEVIAKYHPHGDQAVYDTLVRMAQDFSLRYPLIDGHGNFGSVDGDPPAAYRYTEARLSPIALELLRDIDEETVDFAPNFDETEEEPTVLPSVFPNLIVNGTSGIGIGMASNMAPHNLSEACDAVKLMLKRPKATVADILQVMPGPDFPTGGLILGTTGIREAYETGRGSITMQARVTIEPADSGKSTILITEIPYQVNKANLITSIAKLARDKKIDGITDINDYSDHTGMRIVIDLRRDANPHVILNQLYKHSQLRQNFNIISLVIDEGEPKILAMPQLLQRFIDHRIIVIRRRTEYRLRKAEERAHILEGYLTVLDNLDAVIALIRNSENRDAARKGLQSEFDLSEVQANAVLQMQLGQLTRLDRQKIEDEYRELQKTIEELKAILADEKKIRAIIGKEMDRIKKEYGDERRTTIRPEEAEELSIEDLIAEEDMIITVTRDGYIKRLPVDTYRTQGRGGKGRIALTKKEEDSVETVFVATTHHTILFFTNQGRAYQLRAFEVPMASRQARGTAIINLIQVQPREQVTATVPVAEFDTDGFLFMATRRGVVKKTELRQFDTRRNGGLIAIGLSKDDELRWVKHTDGRRDIVLATHGGKSIRFAESDVRAMGRPAGGVRGITLAKDDYVVSMDVVEPKADILVVSELGFGKRTPESDYRCQSRGGKGLITMKVTAKNGPVVSMLLVEDDDELLIITANGIMIRQRVSEIRRVGRSTQGVRLMRLNDEDRVVAVARIVREQMPQAES